MNIENGILARGGDNICYAVFGGNYFTALLFLYLGVSQIICRKSVFSKLNIGAVNYAFYRLVDFVVLFNEDTALPLVEAIRPDVILKEGYSPCGRCRP